jgi:hypothetical protein
MDLRFLKAGSVSIRILIDEGILTAGLKLDEFHGMRPVVYFTRDYSRAFRRADLGGPLFRGECGCLIGPKL